MSTKKNKCYSSEISALLETQAIFVPDNMVIGPIKLSVTNISDSTICLTRKASEKEKVLKFVQIFVSPQHNKKHFEA